MNYDFAFDVAALEPGDFRLSIPRFQGRDWVLNQERLNGFRAFAAARGVTVPGSVLGTVGLRVPDLDPERALLVRLTRA